MKPIKRIALLAGVVSFIVLLWLLPNINTAKQARYVRTWEDTDVKAASVNVADTTRRKEVKEYKKEVIEDKATLEDVKVEMFSRAIHFTEEKMVEIPDTLVVEELAQEVFEEEDSVYLAKLDTLGGGR